jgi:hypothetical protein
VAAPGDTVIGSTDPHSSPKAADLVDPLQDAIGVSQPRVPLHASMHVLSSLMYLSFRLSENHETQDVP